ncbi:hypothetical protein BT67DRAFT_117807 [Trichocladium antarcticum]|uniref:Spindle pole body-associated protein cut12 domain-containing protein n=1 Tax=Trichocladium antarcticum TaxID=1450529 RepID=A0AAN6ZGL8_9PEZI|nr:hypothetical protein BT67DRAFT_117807 [Trichocladium antarcticum]
MISWALKRNSDSARDAPTGDDTTQIDLPDTPAPVFAVRALRTVLFGTPAPRERRAASKAKKDTAAQQATTRPAPSDQSPARPTGILLTPGTGTTRRKRVSFGNDVKQGSGGAARAGTSGLTDECPGKFPSPWVDRDAGEGQSRPKTKLQQAMEGSRKHNSKDGGTDEKDFAPPVNEPEDGWEEVDDESEFEGDVTTDLNEPHSRSGKYWKSYFETYHTDAKAEMERLVKYKHLAKSYAKMKDAEALDLNQKLKEEQAKVKAMEEKAAEMSRHATLAARRRGGQSDPKLTDELSKQTALATEYKKQVDELESLLQEGIDEVGNGRPRHHRVASPRTQRTIMEAQRELRRARAQVRELEKLQEERDRLRSELKFTEQRAAKLSDENKKLSVELSQSTSRVQDLEKRLEDSKGLYEKLKDDAKSRYLEAQQVLRKKNEKISELEEEIGSLKGEGTDARRATRPARVKSLDEKPTAPRSLEVEESNARPRKDLKVVRRTGSQRRLTSAEQPAETRQNDQRDTGSFKQTSYDDATLASSRALREKIETDLGKKLQPTAPALSDRGNLQDSRSSASSGRSAHSREGHSRPRRTDRASRSAWALSAPADKASLDDLLGESRDNKRATSKTTLEQARTLSGRPMSPESDVPEVDLQQRFARLGGPDPHNSAVWSTMNTPRTTLPVGRHAAALARLQRKRAEREMQRLERDKENANPS